MASAWKDGLRFVFMFCVLIINTLTGGFSTPLPLFFLTPVFLTRPLHSSRGKGTTLAGIRLFFKEGLCLPREPHRPPLAGRPVGLTQPFPSEVEGLQMLARGSLFQKSLIGRAWTLALPDGFSFPLLPPSLIPSHANLYTHPREEPPPCRCPHGHSTLGLQDPARPLPLRGGVGAEASWVFSSRVLQDAATHWEHVPTRVVPGMLRRGPRPSSESFLSVWGTGVSNAPCSGGLVVLGWGRASIGVSSPVTKVFTDRPARAGTRAGREPTPHAPEPSVLRSVHRPSFVSPREL